MNQGRTFKQASAQWLAQKKGAERFLSRLHHGALFQEWVLLAAGLLVALLTFFWMKLTTTPTLTLTWLLNLGAHLVVVMASVGVLVLGGALYVLVTQRALWTLLMVWGLWGISFLTIMLLHLPLDLLILSVMAIGIAFFMLLILSLLMWRRPSLFPEPQQKTTFFLGFSTGKLKKRGHARSIRPSRMVGLSLTDAAQNTVVLGGIGAGKTTRVMHPFLVQVFCQDFGGLIFDMKGDFKQAVMQAAAVCERPISIIGPSYTTFNLIAGLTPEMASTFLRICLTAGTSNSTENFWVDTATELCRNVLGVLSFALEHYHLNALFRYIFELNYRNTVRGELSLLLTTLSPAEKERFTSYGQYYDTVFAAFDDKVKEGVKATVSQVLSPFSHPELKRAFCATDKAPLRMESVLQGTVYLVEMPFALWGSTSRVACQLIKLLFFNVVQKRPLNPTWDQQRPLFFLCDEYQNLISGSSKEDLSDLNFWDKSRSANLVGMISTQSVSSFYAALGSHDVAHTVLQNFRQKLCFRTEDTATLSYLSRVLDRVDVKVKQTSKTTGTRQASISHSTHEREKAVLDAQLIRQLKQDEVIALLSIQGRSLDDVLRVRAIYVSNQAETTTKKTNLHRLSCSPTFYAVLKDINASGIHLDGDPNPTEQALMEEGYVRDKLEGIPRENAADQALWHAFLMGTDSKIESKAYFNYQLSGEVDLTRLEEHAVRDLLTHWSNAAKEFSNPLLRARYADLVWDFGNLTKTHVDRHPVFAASAIKNYLNIVNNGLVKSHTLLDQYLSRAFCLSVALEQADDITLVKEKMLTQLAFPENQKFFYVKSFYTLWKNNLLNEASFESMNQLIQWMCDNPSHFLGEANHQGIMPILDCFLLTCQDNTKKVEIVKGCTDAFCNYATPLVCAAMLDFLEKAKAFLSKPHKEQLEQKIADINNVKPPRLKETPSAATRQTVQAITPSFSLVGSAEEAFQRFLDQFLVFSDRHIFEHSLRFKDSVRISKDESVNGRKEIRISKPATWWKDSLFVRQSMKEVQSMLLVDAFNNLVKTYHLDASFFIQKIKDILVHDNHKQALAHGISAFFKEEFIPALFVLVPHVEGILMDIARDRCKVSFSHQDEKEEHHLKTLGVILSHEHVMDYLSHDLTTHLMCIFSKARELFIKNTFSHRRFEEEGTSNVNTLWVIHALFSVCLRLEEKK